MKWGLHWFATWNGELKIVQWDPDRDELFQTKSKKSQAIGWVIRDGSALDNSRTFPECRVFVGLSENILSKDSALKLSYIWNLKLEGLSHREISCGWDRS